MRRFLFSMAVIILSFSKMSGQEYIRSTDTFLDTRQTIIFIGHYEMDKEGLHHYVEGPKKLVTTEQYKYYSKGIEHFFCFDKKAKSFYFYTDNAIAIYSPNHDYLKEKMLDEMKANNVINTNEIDVTLKIAEIKAKMDLFFNKKNDSILFQRKMLEEKKAKDAIETASHKQEQRDNYRRTHNWHELNLENTRLINCKNCNDKHPDQSIFVLSISSDTIYFSRNHPEFSLMDFHFYKVHYAKIDYWLERDAKFIDYVDLWKDSIANNNKMTNIIADRTNIYLLKDFIDKVKTSAPWGFIQNWGWNLNIAGGIEPYFSFFNTTDKVIKYVDLYFSIYNDVGDKCYLKYEKSYIGKIRGVGPVGQFDSASWNWEKATHYTSDDASEMKINKVIITYMDGTQKVLTGNMIKYGN